MASQSNCSAVDDTNSKQRQSNHGGDDDDVRLEELERSEQTLREKLEDLCRLNDKFKIQFEEAEAELMEVRTQLKHVEEARAKLADSEFDILSLTIVRKKKIAEENDGINKSRKPKSIGTLFGAYQQVQEPPANLM